MNQEVRKNLSEKAFNTLIMLKDGNIPVDCAKSEELPVGNTRFEKMRISLREECSSIYCDDIDKTLIEINKIIKQ